MSNTNAVPSFILKVDGSRLPPDKEADVKEIFIFEKTDAPSRFELKLNNEGFRWTDNDELDVGAEVKISIGYKDALEEIMVGEVTGIRANMRFGEANTVTYIGYSKSHRLVRGRKSQAFTEMTVTEIVQQIASDAGMQSDVENIPGTRSYTLQRGLSDFNYLISLADRYGCTITDIDNKLTFKRQIANSGEDVVVEYNKTLVEFYPTTDLNEQITEIEVRGWNRSTHEAIRGSKTHSDASSEGGKLVEESFGAAKEVLLDVRVTSPNEADQLALDRITTKGRGYITGYGVCLGDPAIRAGGIIKIEGIAERYKGKYYLFATKHRLEIGIGYSTTFYISSNVATQGNAANTTGSSSPGNSAAAGQQNQQTQAAQQTGGAADEQKNPNITNLKWMKDGQEITEAMVEDRVTLTADVTEIDDGSTIKITILEKDYNSEDDFIMKLSGRVKNGKVEADWQVIYTEDEDDIDSQDEQENNGYTIPEYIFVMESGKHGVKTEDSPLLELKDFIEITFINDETDEPYSNTEFTVILPDGSEEKGTTDENGIGFIEKVVPGSFKFWLGEDEDEFEYDLEEYKVDK